MFAFLFLLTNILVKRNEFPSFTWNQFSLWKKLQPLLSSFVPAHQSFCVFKFSYFRINNSVFSLCQMIYIEFFCGHTSIIPYKLLTNKVRLSKWFLSDEHVKNICIAVLNLVWSWFSFWFQVGRSPISTCEDTGGWW